MVNSVRGLCNGVSSALFGFIFYLFNVNLGYTSLISLSMTESNLTTINRQLKRLIYSSILTRNISGLPFLFGTFLLTLALVFTLLLPHSTKH